MDNLVFTVVKKVYLSFEMATEYNFILNNLNTGEPLVMLPPLETDSLCVFVFL